MILDKAAPALVFAAFFTLVFGTSEAFATKKVKVRIQVIEASKTAKPSMPKDIRPEVASEISALGFASAKITDQLDTQVEHQGSFSLEIRDNKDKATKRTVRVTVLDKTKDVIKLRIELPSMKFKADTEHKKGGTILLAARRAKNKALFLAVTPIP